MHNIAWEFSFAIELTNHTDFASSYHFVTFGMPIIYDKTRAVTDTYINNWLIWQLINNVVLLDYLFSL